MSGPEHPPERPRKDRPLQDGQDPTAPETRPTEVEGPWTTPQARTDHEQDADDPAADDDPEG